MSHNNKQETAQVYKYIPCKYNAQTRKPTHTKYPHPPHTQENTPAYRTYLALLLGAVLKHVKALALRLAPAAHLPRTMLPCSIAFTAYARFVCGAFASVFCVCVRVRVCGFVCLSTPTADFEHSPSHDSLDGFPHTSAPRAGTMRKHARAIDINEGCIFADC